MKRRYTILAAVLSVALIAALVIGFWPGGGSAAPSELVQLPGERSSVPAEGERPAEDAAEAESGALPLAAAAASAQKPFTPPIQNLKTESIGAPAPEIPAEQLIIEPADVTRPEILEDETVSFSGDRFMLKLAPSSDGTLTPELQAAGVTALEPMMRLDNGAWFLAYVGEGDVKAVVPAVRAVSGVLAAEFDFVSETLSEMPMAETVAEAVRDNPSAMDAWQLRACGVQEAWAYQAAHDLPLAGAGTIVAVIDTGVDETHKDLAASMWHNPGEVPDNGRDDDGNGYTDDYCGVNIVANRGSGTDDHGHGTHVAGIIAAANNKEGSVGVAYNTKIMSVKAGQASGYFTQSDIAKAIVYAYENGADVINMSFGGTESSLAVQDALAAAYSRCVLVAAAGINRAPNAGEKAVPNYPAAFPFVIGVMSVEPNGEESSFTNYDAAAFDAAEYEVYAPGGQILSTIPGDRYAVWSGTSMAAPVVSSVAAMLRADLPDREAYPVKYLCGQLVSTGSFVPNGAGSPHCAMCDALAALTAAPQPVLGVSGYQLIDARGVAEKNNADGRLDAGETVSLGLTLRNRWGAAKDVVVTVSVEDCPYVTVSADASAAGGASASVSYGAVETFSEQSCGPVYDDAGALVGWERPFWLHVDPDCPNDTVVTLHISGTAGNALNDADSASYSFSGEINLPVRRGVVLPHIITEDTTLTADNYYLLPHSLLINEGATVTVEPGTQIEFWSPNPDDGTCPEYSKIVCVGTLRMLGAEDAHIRLFPSAESFGSGHDGYSSYDYIVYVTNDNGSGGKGVIDMRYCDIFNPQLYVTTLEQCRLESTRGWNGSYTGRSGNNNHYSYSNISSQFQLAKDTLFRGIYCGSSGNCYDGCAFTDCRFGSTQSIWNGLLLGNSGSESVRGYHYGRDAAFNVTATAVYHDAETGVSYLSVRIDKSGYDYLEYFARAASAVAEDLGGHVLRVESPEELAFLTDAGVFAENDRYCTLAEYDSGTNSVYWNEKWSGSCFVRFGPVGDFLPVQCDSDFVRFARLQSDGKLHLPYDGYDYGSEVFLIELADSDGALTAEAAQAMIDARPDTAPDRSFVGNAVLNRICTADSGDWLRIRAYNSSSYEKSPLSGNYWGTEDLNLMEKQITDFEDDVSLADLDPAGFLTEAPEQVWPFVSAVEIYDHAGEQVTTVGNEPLTFRVRFNRDMDESIPLSVRFGSKAPYNDYEIDGRWVDARTWEGSTTLTTLIENGTQVLRISNGRAADEDKELLDDYGRFTFTIDDTSAAMDLIMQAAADDNGILLTWNQDAFDTLAGYHVYRSESENGYYQRLNRSVIPADTREFYDDTVEPGKVYYYNFTVVKSDLTESAPSGKVKIMSKDTMAPVMYHTPVYQAFAGTNLVINATVTDNVAVQSVKLCYRQTGASDWTVAEMNKLNDKYSAVISAAYVTTNGLEYYIEATDGNTRVWRGTADEPYAVTVQQAIDLTQKGDVNGDGRITNLDALMLLQAVNDRLNLDAAQFARADINDDGELSAAEALRILHYVSGKVTSILF